MATKGRRIKTRETNGKNLTTEEGIQETEELNGWIMDRGLAIVRLMPVNLSADIKADSVKLVPASRFELLTPRV